MHNVYMPCVGNSTKLQFETTIRELQEITAKYSNGHVLFICGEILTPPYQGTQQMKGTYYSDISVPKQPGQPARWGLHIIYTNSQH